MPEGNKERWDTFHSENDVLEENENRGKKSHIYKERLQMKGPWEKNIWYVVYQWIPSLIKKENIIETTKPWINYSI